MSAIEPDFLSDINPLALETSYNEYPSKELVESVVSKFSERYGDNFQVQYRDITDDEWEILHSRMKIHDQNGYSSSEFGVFVLKINLTDSKHLFEKYVANPFPKLNILDSGPKMYRIPVLD